MNMIPNVRHMSLQSVPQSELSSASIGGPARRPGTVDPETGANTPRDSDFKFRTIENLHEVIEMTSDMAE